MPLGARMPAPTPAAPPSAASPAPSPRSQTFHRLRSETKLSSPTASPINPSKPVGKTSKFNLSALPRGIGAVWIREPRTPVPGRLPTTENNKKKARERKNAVGGDRIQEAEFEEEMEKDSER